MLQSIPLRRIIARLFVMGGTNAQLPIGRQGPLPGSRQGQLKEAEVTRTAPSSQPVQGNIRHGFVYERVPHITLKSIANNAEIDVIWDQWQAKLEPLRESLNAALKKSWQDWEIPCEADAKWPDAPKKLHAEWWQARIARQQEMDKSIAAKAEFEYLYDKPYDDKKKVRVAGPFTVESLIPLQQRIETVGDDADLQEVYDTERHLLYVACTRARDHLLITSVEPASEFLDDLRI